MAVEALNGRESTPPEIVQLKSLTALTQGRAEVFVGILDGPVDWQHAALSHADVRHLGGSSVGCDRTEGSACAHGTFVAGILAASRGSGAPAVCPGCTFLSCAVFADSGQTYDNVSATTGSLAQAIVDCVNAEARILNLSAATEQPTTCVDRSLQEALDLAARSGVLVIAAAGNQGTLGTSTITRHPWVVPVVACDAARRRVSHSNLAASMGRRGVAAPDAITSLGLNDKMITLAGTSFATPIVTGTIALGRGGACGATTRRHRCSRRNEGADRPSRGVQWSHGPNSDVDQLYSFDRDALVENIPLPADVRQGNGEEQLRSAAGDCLIALCSLPITQERSTNIEH